MSEFWSGRERLFQNGHPERSEAKLDSFYYRLELRS